MCLHGIAQCTGSFSVNDPDGWQMSHIGVIKIFIQMGNGFVYRHTNHLYAASARAAKAMGYRKIITYTLDSESGSSLRAAGWSCAGLAGGKCWTGSRKPASALYPAQMKLRYEKLL